MVTECQRDALRDKVKANTLRSELNNTTVKVTVLVQSEQMIETNGLLSEQMVKVNVLLSEQMVKVNVLLSEQMVKVNVLLS